jgi:hypothetical protein
MHPGILRDNYRGGPQATTWARLSPPIKRIRRPRLAGHQSATGGINADQRSVVVSVLWRRYGSRRSISFLTTP